MSKLIADGPQAWVDIACRLPADIEALKLLRQTLRQRLKASPIMDAPAYVRALESLYPGFMERMHT